MDIINNLAKGKLSLSICHGFSMKMIIIKVCHLSLGCHHNNHTLNKKKKKITDKFLFMNFWKRHKMKSPFKFLFIAFYH